MFLDTSVSHIIGWTWIQSWGRDKEAFGRDLDIFELSRGANSMEQRKPPKEATFFMDMDVIQKLLLAGISLWKRSLVIDVIKTWAALIAIFGCFYPKQFPIPVFLAPSGALVVIMV